MPYRTKDEQEKADREAREAEKAAKQAEKDAAKRDDRPYKIK